MRRSLVLVSTLFLLGASASIKAQELVIRVEEPVHARNLSGVVIAFDNEPVFQATVELMSSDWKRVIKSTVTDHRGSFRFKSARRGTYFLRIWGRGFQQVEFEVKVDRSGKRRPKFMLEVGT